MKYEYDYTRIRDRYFPLIPIKLGSKEEAFETFALVDSGASVSLFRNDIAYQLGIDIESGIKNILEGISGKITVYIHKIPIVIENVSFVCKIGFSEEYVASFNLLGRDNFFANFLITFNEIRKKIILESLKE